MHRRAFMASALTSVSVMLAGKADGRSASAFRLETTTPGHSLGHPVPLGTPARVGEWTVTLENAIVEAISPTFGVALSATYHGSDPTWLFATLQPALIGHDKHLYAWQDATDDLEATVVAGATVEGVVTFFMPPADIGQPDDVLLAFAWGADRTALLLHPSYVYFSLDRRQKASDRTSAVLATPGATQVPTPLTPLGGLESLVFRSYRYIGNWFGTSITGQPGWIAFELLQFSSATLAKHNMPTLRDDVVQNEINSLYVGWHLGEVRDARMPGLGDESSAGVASVSADDAMAGSNEGAFAFVIARRDRWLYLVFGHAESGNPIALFGNLVGDMLRRRIGRELVSIDANGIHHGGLWDVLPTPQDLPEWYEHMEDYEA